MGVVEKDPGGDGGGSGDRSDDDGGEDAAEEVAPPGKRSGPPPLQDAGFSGGDETHAVGVPGGEGESEDGVPGDIGVGGLRVTLMRGDEQDDREPDADGDRPAAGEQAGLVADLGGQEPTDARHPLLGGADGVGHRRVPSGVGWPMAAK